METEVIELIEVELKYCERCGGLWLRRTGDGCVYCAGCELAMAEFPQATAKQMRHAKYPAGDLEGVALEYGILCAEGHA
jgi:Zn-finger nucleic acid-binding protein